MRDWTLRARQHGSSAGVHSAPSAKRNPTAEEAASISSGAPPVARDGRGDGETIDLTLFEKPR
jgi:hypothetical protein